MLLRGMDSTHNPSPRVRSHATAGFINFVDFCDSSRIRPYLDAMLGSCLRILQEGPRIVQEQAVALVSTSAMNGEEALGPQHYDQLMPLLQNAWHTCPDTQVDTSQILLLTHSVTPALAPALTPSFALSPALACTNSRTYSR